MIPDDTGKCAEQLFRLVIRERHLVAAPKPQAPHHFQPLLFRLWFVSHKNRGKNAY